VGARDWGIDFIFYFLGNERVEGCDCLKRKA
jgi:hypothetical protein